MLNIQCQLESKMRSTPSILDPNKQTGSLFDGQVKMITKNSLRTTNELLKS